MKLSKKITFSLLSIGLTLQVLSPMAAFAATKTDDIVVGQGLLTSSKFETFDDCDKTTADGVSKKMDENLGVKSDSKKEDGGDAEEKKSGTIKDEFPSSDKENKDGGKAAGIFSKLVNWIAKGFKDVFTVQCGVGFMSYITKISTPVNLTNNPVIMDIMGITQMIALGSSVIFIAAFGLMYALGYQNMDPVKFGLRMFVAMVVVYYLPYLLQDILNLNNMLVHSISKISIPTSASDVVVAGTVSSGFALSGIAASVMGALLTLGGTVLAPVWVIVAIAVILFAIYMLTFLVKLILWWYMRMLMIFILAIFGPFFVIMTALPQTAKMSKKWLKSFIAESFSQTFLAVGLYIFINIFMRMSEFNEAVNMGLLGNVFIFYAMLVTLQDFPEFGKSLLGGGSGGWGSRNINGAAAAMGAFAANAIDHSARKVAEGVAKKDFKEGIAKQADIDKGFTKNIDDVLTGKNVNDSRRSSGGGMGTGSGPRSLAKGGGNGVAGDALGADGLMANQLNKKNGNNEEAIAIAAMGMDSLDKPRKSNEFDSTEAVKSADSDTLKAIMSSDLSRQDTVEGMAQELMAANPQKYDQGQGKFNTALAKAHANDLLEKVEAKNGMSWEASQQIKKLRQSGDLNQDTARAVLKKDVENNPALYSNLHSDVKDGDRKELEKRAMNDLMGKHGNLIDDKSVRESTEVKAIPQMKMGDVKLTGGTKRYSESAARNGTDWSGTAMHSVDNQSMINSGEGKRVDYAAEARKTQSDFQGPGGGGGNNPPGGGGNNGDGPRPGGGSGGVSKHVSTIQNNARLDDELEAREEQTRRQEAEYKEFRQSKENDRAERRDNNPKFDHLKGNGDDRNFSNPTVETSAPSNSESSGPTVEGKAPIASEHLDTQSFDDSVSDKFEMGDRTTTTNFNSFADDNTSADRFSGPSFESSDSVSSQEIELDNYSSSNVEQSEPSGYGFSGPSFESSDSVSSQEIELDNYNSSTVERSDSTGPSSYGSSTDSNDVEIDNSYSSDRSEPSGYGFGGPSFESSDSVSSQEIELDDYNSSTVERSDSTGPSSYGSSTDSNDVELDNSYSSTSNRSEPTGYGFSGPSFESSDSTVSENIEIDDYNSSASTTSSSYGSSDEGTRYNGPSGYSSYGQETTDLDSFEIGGSSVERSEPTGPSNYSSAPETNETVNGSSGFSTYGQNATNLDSFEIGGSTNEQPTTPKKETPRETGSKNFFDEMMGENRKPIQDKDNPFNRK